MQQNAKKEASSVDYGNLNNIDLEASFVRMESLLSTLYTVATFAEDEARTLSQHTFIGILKECTENIMFLCEEAQDHLELMLRLTASAVRGQEDKKESVQ